MSLIGYARVSTTDQSLDLQLEQLAGAGADKIFGERMSGTVMEGRKELEALLDYVREGDVVLVTRLDRLARSMGDLVVLLGRLKDKGVGLRCLHQGLDTTTIEGRLMTHILGAFAEFETAIRKERQAEGIAKAKAAGRYKDQRFRKRRVTRAEILAEKELGLSASAIAKKLKIHPRTVYKWVPEGWGEAPASLAKVNAARKAAAEAHNAPGHKEAPGSNNHESAGG